MNFKKIAIIALCIYAAIGVTLYFSGGFTKDKVKETKVQTAVVTDPSLYTWNVKDETLSSYKAPSYMRNSALDKYVGEAHYSNTPEFKPERYVEYLLMSMFAELQLGDPMKASSYINPEISYKDYDVRKPKEIEAAAEAYRNNITKKKSIREITLELIEETEKTKLFKVDLYYENNEHITFNIPMLQLLPEEEHDYELDESHEEHYEDMIDGHVHDEDSFWFVNINLRTIEELTS